MHIILYLTLVVSVFVNFGCSSAPKKTRPHHCGFYINDTELSRPMGVDEKLDYLSGLYELQCYEDVIGLGNKILNDHRDKFYSVTAEIGEIITPEGTFSDYVLESYERVHLRLLISLSHVLLNQREKAIVEFRKSLNESAAQLYNWGVDPLNLVIQATMTETYKFGIDPRPFWVALKTHPLATPQAQSFADAQIKRLDRKESLKWKMTGYGKFFEYDWHVNFSGKKNSSYRIEPLKQIPNDCYNANTLMITVKPWFTKLASRYNMDYHPLLNVKSWTRLPVGIFYGATTIAAGAAVGLGGCAIAAASKIDDICKYSLEAGFKVVGETANVVNYTVKPDMRHWSEVPGAFYFTPQNYDNEVCAPENVADTLTYKSVSYFE